MATESATTAQHKPARIDWGKDQELFYWAMKWKVRSEDIKEAAMSAGPNIRHIEACLRRKGWLR